MSFEFNTISVILKCYIYLVLGFVCRKKKRNVSLQIMYKSKILKHEAIYQLQCNVCQLSDNTRRTQRLKLNKKCRGYWLYESFAKINIYTIIMLNSNFNFIYLFSKQYRNFVLSLILQYPLQQILLLFFPQFNNVYQHHIFIFFVVLNKLSLIS